jgi:hypothetical protein
VTAGGTQQAGAAGPPLVPVSGNVDSRLIAVGAVRALIGRWGLEKRIRRSEARNLRRALFGSRGVKVVPVGYGRMSFPLFDGSLHLLYEGAGTRGQSAFVTVRVVGGIAA